MESQVKNAAYDRNCAAGHAFYVGLLMKGEFDSKEPKGKKRKAEIEGTFVKNNKVRGVLTGKKVRALAHSDPFRLLRAVEAWRKSGIGVYKFAFNSWREFKYTSCLAMYGSMRNKLRVKDV